MASMRGQIPKSLLRNLRLPVIAAPMFIASRTKVDVANLGLRVTHRRQNHEL
jgi:hypothetical protein